MTTNTRVSKGSAAEGRLGVKAARAGGGCGGDSGGGGAWRVAGGGASGRVDGDGWCRRLLSLGAEGDEVGHCDGAVMAQASLDFCAFAQRATGSAAPATAAREMIVGQAANERRSRAPRW